MIDEISTIYEQKVFNGGSEKQVISESEKAKGSITAGRDFGSKAKEMSKDTGPENVDVKAKPTQSKKFSSGSDVVKENDMSDVLPKSTFQELFKSTLIKEFSDESDSPLEKGDFNDEEGEFAPEGEASEASEDEQVDVATELRMLIDRLTEIAEHLGAYDDEGEEGAPVEGSEEGIPAEEPVPVGEAATATKELKPLADSKGKMQSKGNMKVKSNMDPTGGTAAKGGPGKDSADGKLKPLGKSKFSPKMSLKADTKSPMGKTNANLF